MAVYDQSRLPYLVEGFIATGVERLAVPAWSGLADHLTLLPPALQECIDIVDQRKSAVKKFEAFCEPIYEEFGSSLLLTRAMPCTRHKREFQDESLRGALHFFFTELLDFFLGMEHRLQISQSPWRLGSIIEDLLSYCRNPQSRANLARLLGVLRSYRQVGINSLTFKAGASPAYLAQFLQLVEDERYHQMSKEVHLMGLGNLRAGVPRMRRLVKKIVTTSPFNEIYRLAAKVLAASQGLPLPDADAFASLFSEPYLPVAAPLRTAYAGARKALKEQEPGSSTPRVEDVIRKGVVVRL